MSKPSCRISAECWQVLSLIAFASSLVLAISGLSGCAAKPKGTTPVLGYDGRFAAGTSQRESVLTNPVGSRDEELWVISRSISDNRPRNDECPGTGAMMARTSRATTEVPLPLKHTDVTAYVSGFIATVDVTQQFQNPYDGKIEAIYVFPLPHDAAVSEFIMTIGERRIRGIIRERKEAEQIYQEAKRQGYVASLMTEERPNIFTESIANIEPGEDIEVNIKYFQTLAYMDGWYEFEFPMVVGPRFNPPGALDGIGAVARGRAGASGQKAEVQYLKPDERSGHDISLELEVDAGVAIEDSACHTHAIAKTLLSPERLRVTLEPEDRIPNKDFVLRYRVAGERIKSSLLTQRDARGGYFTLMLYPPADVYSPTRQPVEMVFVLDCSGSMWGRPLEQAKAAVEQALRRLQPGDTFQLIRFSNDASRLGPAPVPATRDNLRRGLAYLNSLNSEGGTMMIEGIKAALDFPHDPRRLRCVCFLTDGYIGNEAEILGEIHKRLGEARIFSFGVGSSVNRYLLDSMARFGRGAVAYIGSNDDAAGVMNDLVERISHPALSDIQVDGADMDAAEIYPRKAPDLFPGRPVILTGRFKGEAGAGIHVSGTAAGQRIAFDVAAQPGQADSTRMSIAKVWARMKIADLTELMICDRDEELPAEIKRVALNYGLLSDFTAFIAVDSTRRTEGVPGTTVPVALPVPDGVNYKTTVDED